MGSNIYITLSTQVRQWKVGPGDGLVQPIQGLVQDDDPSVDLAGFGAIRSVWTGDWGCIGVHRPRIARVLEESLRFERANPKKRTIEAPTDRTEVRLGKAWSENWPATELLRPEAEVDQRDYF